MSWISRWVPCVLTASPNVCVGFIDNINQTTFHFVVSSFQGSFSLGLKKKCFWRQAQMTQVVSLLFITHRDITLMIQPMWMSEDLIKRRCCQNFHWNVTLVTLFAPILWKQLWSDSRNTNSQIYLRSNFQKWLLCRWNEWDLKKWVAGLEHLTTREGICIFKL